LMGQVIPHGSAVYIRYRDHVLFRNTPKPIHRTAERETIGWLIRQNKEFMYIQHDRTIDSLHYTSGRVSGLVLLKSCILEIHALPSQNFSRWSLSSQNEITNPVEYALQKKKRKTQPKH
jgi:hypothetical protein